MVGRALEIADWDFEAAEDFDPEFDRGAAAEAGCDLAAAGGFGLEPDRDSGAAAGSHLERVAEQPGSWGGTGLLSGFLAGFLAGWASWVGLIGRANWTVESEYMLAGVSVPGF